MEGMYYLREPDINTVTAFAVLVVPGDIAVRRIPSTGSGGE